MFDFKQAIKQDKAFADGVWEKLDKKLSKSAVSAREKIPYMSVDGVYNDIGKEAPHGWTNGFWPGLMWLMYVGTKNEEYRKTAEVAEKTMDAAVGLSAAAAAVCGLRKGSV